MTEKNLRVVARVVALPEKVEALKNILINLIEPTRQEQGCIVYELVQNQAEPTEFVFVEQWESEAHLQAHLASPHIQDAIAACEELWTAPPDIRLYQLLA